MKYEELIRTNQSFVEKIANKFYNVEKEDLMQVGYIGLIKAYNRYRIDGTTKFSTYAYDYVFGEMYALVNKSKSLKLSRDILKLYKLIEKTRYLLAQKLGKVPNNLELANYLEKPVEEIEDAIIGAEVVMSLDSNNDDERSKYETLKNLETITIDEKLDVINSMETLNDSEKEIIKARYFKDMTQSEIAKKLKMTQVMVSRYEKKGIEKMRLYMTV